jgi:hypothetical protein
MQGSRQERRGTRGIHIDISGIRIINTIESVEAQVPLTGQKRSGDFAIEIQLSYPVDMGVYSEWFNMCTVECVQRSVRIVPKEVLNYCASTGHSDPQFVDGGWWAYPPVGVIPVPLSLIDILRHATEAQIELLKANRLLG